MLPTIPFFPPLPFSPFPFPYLPRKVGYRTREKRIRRRLVAPNYAMVIAVSSSISHSHLSLLAKPARIIYTFLKLAVPRQKEPIGIDLSWNWIFNSLAVMWPLSPHFFFPFTSPESANLSTSLGDG